MTDDDFNEIIEKNYKPKPTSDIGNKRVVTALQTGLVVVVLGGLGAAFATGVVAAIVAGWRFIFGS